MKPYPSVFHTCTSKSRPATGFSKPNKLDEASNCTPPTSDPRHVGRSPVPPEAADVYGGLVSSAPFRTAARSFGWTVCALTCQLLFCLFFIVCFFLLCLLFVVSFHISLDRFFFFFSFSFSFYFLCFSFFFLFSFCIFGICRFL